MVLEQIVQNKKRSPGRPRCFNDDDVLDRAVRVFWEKGYEATTVDDLTAAMGMSRPSLYNAYGDKEALFSRCLARYGETIGSTAVAALQSAATTRGAITAFLHQAIHNSTTDGNPRGCLIACVIPAIDSEAMRTYMAEALSQSDSAIAACLQNGIDRGELPPDFPKEARARFIASYSAAIACRARAGTAREALLTDADEFAIMVLTF